MSVLTKLFIQIEFIERLREKGPSVLNVKVMEEKLVDIQSQQRITEILRGRTFEAKHVHIFSHMPSRIERT